MYVSQYSFEFYISLLNFVLNHYIWDDFQHDTWLSSKLLGQVQGCICTPIKTSRNFLNIFPMSGFVK